MDSDWLKRRNSIDQELGGRALDIADVRIVQLDSQFRGSRERAPMARHVSTIAAPAAGHHVGYKIDGIDGSASSSRNVGIWLVNNNHSMAVTCFLANRSAVTLSAENEINPGWRDNDPDVRPRLFEIDMETAAIPTAPGAGIPMVCQAVPSNNLNLQLVLGAGGVFWFENTNQQSLFFIGNTAATIFHYTVMWQAVRL